MQRKKQFLIELFMKRYVFAFLYVYFICKLHWNVIFRYDKYDFFMNYRNTLTFKWKKQKMTKYHVYVSFTFVGMKWLLFSSMKQQVGSIIIYMVYRRHWFISKIRTINIFFYYPNYFLLTHVVYIYYYLVNRFPNIGFE